MSRPGNQLWGMTAIWLPGLLFFLLQSCVNDPEPKGADLSVGDTLPQFSVELFDGSIVSRNSLAGKTSVIVFFNTACPDCQKELPVIQKLWESYGTDPDFKLIAIAREEDSESIAEYWELNHFTIPWSPQDTRSVYNLFATSGIPRIYISDKQEIIRYIFDDKDMPLLETLMEAINHIKN